MAYTVAQRNIISAILRVGARLGATRKLMIAALAAGKVETGFANLDHGEDGDNKGVFQQRPNWGTVAQRMNVETAAEKFYREAKRVDSPSLSAGGLAVKVQRPAARNNPKYVAAAAVVDSLVSGAGMADVAGASNVKAIKPAGAGFGGYALLALALAILAGSRGRR
jgi:hypothetical protein